MGLYNSIPQGVTLVGTDGQPIGIGGAIPITSGGTDNLSIFHINSGGSSGTVNGVSTGTISIPSNARGFGINYVGTGTANTFGANTAVTGGQSFNVGISTGVQITLAADASTVIDGFWYT